VAWLAAFAALSIVTGAAPQAGVVRVDVSHPVQTLHPLEALGSTVDKEPAGSMGYLYTKKNVRLMLDAGFGFLSYRLFTELTGEDWHWNPAGSFSDGNQGYWTSSAAPGSKPIVDSYGYRLPRTGNTSDEGASESYSRLTDGDPATYWKSNPYLTSRYTGESDALHPQWIVVDLGSRKPVDAVRIAWATPYAVNYDVQYWIGSDPIGDPAHGTWRMFAGGRVRGAAGGTLATRVASAPLNVRYLRVLMARSSNTCAPGGSSDVRNCVGYAAYEIFAGTLDAQGAFHDLVYHAPCGGYNPGKQACGVRQTATYVSSVDPWHRASDRVRNQEQPGLDLIARSGLTRSIGAIYPIPLFYSTPENAANEVGYLRSRRYPVAYVEMGEEIDGQYAAPEDYAALYIEYAKALHAVDPALRIGGPVFQGTNSDTKWWPDARGDVSWLHRFLRYLRSHRVMNDLDFMSFEHYPFGGCEHGAALQRDLLDEPSIVRAVVNAWQSDGLPPAVPMFVTEAGFSATNFTQVPMQIEGALWQADYMAGFLTQGVKRVVYYQYEPVPLSANKSCPPDWGNLTMFVAGTHGNIRALDAEFYGAQMITQQWLEPGNGAHVLYRAAMSGMGKTGAPFVTAYAVKRPDGTWSLLLDNKDTAEHRVSIVFEDRSRKRHFTGMLVRATFGRQQYRWRGPNELPFSRGIVTGIIPASSTIVIPPRTLLVVRGHIGGS
jgi:hypothetical protein